MLASGVPARLTSERYFALVDEGLLGPDDRVELLEGIIVAKEPQTPWHASGVRWVFDTLVGYAGLARPGDAAEPVHRRAALGPRARRVHRPGNARGLSPASSGNGPSGRRGVRYVARPGSSDEVRHLRGGGSSRVLDREPRRRSHRRGGAAAAGSEALLRGRPRCPARGDDRSGGVPSPWQWTTCCRRRKSRSAELELEEARDDGP